jgi:hypothetical protein
MRYVNPLVEGSSPSPVICDRTRQNTTGNAKTPQIIGFPAPSTSWHSTSPSRQKLTDNAPKSLLRATRVLEEDSDLAAVVNAWHTLPEALRSGIVAMVKAASGK